MQFTIRNCLNLLFVCLALGLSQCGKKSKAQEVVASIQPESPIIIAGDFPISKNGTTTTVKGPWTQFKISVNNTSDTPVTVVAITVVVVATDQKGKQTSSSTSFNGVTENHSVEVGSGDTATTVECVYSDLGQFDPGKQPNTVATKFNDYYLYARPSAVCPDSAPNCCPTLVPTFYLGSVTPSVTPGSQTTTTVTYSVQFKFRLSGWFGDRNTPQESFEHEFTAHSQYTALQ